MINQGDIVIIREKKDRLNYPDGAVLLVTCKSPSTGEIGVTDKINSETSNLNPYILENPDTKFKITKEQFESQEFVDKKDLEVVSFKKKSVISLPFLLAVSNVILIICLLFSLKG